MPILTMSSPQTKIKMKHNISGIASLLGIREPEYPDYSISVLLTDSRSLTSLSYFPDYL